MHRARHTFTPSCTASPMEAASQAPGHSDLSTTLGIYGHQAQRSLERAMEAFAEAREAEEAASRGNDSPSRLD
jgi:integrase